MTKEIYKLEKTISAFFVFLGFEVAYLIALLFNWSDFWVGIFFILSIVFLVFVSYKAFKVMFFDDDKKDK